MAVNKITDGSTTVFFFAIRGQAYGLGRDVANESRPGEDGTAFRILANKPKPFKLDCECHVDNYGAAHSLGLTVFALKGHVIDFTQEGVSNVNCLILDVDVPEPEVVANIRRGVYPADGSVKNGAGAIFRCQIELLYAAAS